MSNESRGDSGYSDFVAPTPPPLPPIPVVPLIASESRDVAPVYTPPNPGSPEFRAMIEHHKDVIEAEFGVRPDVILAIG